MANWSSVTEHHTDRDEISIGDETLAATGSLPPTSDTEFSTGDTFGRYVVLEPVGRGAMGVVFAAYDRTLDRKVALKMFNAKGQADHDRVIREARSLAQVRSQHVVAVHDVGVIDERVFLTMEFIEGGTLRKWLHDKRRTCDEILATFLLAGRGLAAAHAAGIYHRDFKPANVMVGANGRVAVTDFGLARRATDADPVEAPNVELDASAEDAVTNTGGMAGTPGFMAAEQWAGEPGDASSDQFAFCVSLYRALYGHPPFDGRSIPQLMTSVIQGELIGPPARPASGRVRRALVRGLSREPAARFPDMRAVLAAIRPSPPRRRGTMLMVGATAMIAGSVYLVSTGSDVCRDGASLQDVWNEDVRSELRAEAEAADPAPAQSAIQNAERSVDRYVESWTEAYLQACAIDGHGNRHVALSCLRARRVEFMSLLQPEGADNGSRMIRFAAQGVTAAASCLPHDDTSRRGTTPEERSAIREMNLAVQNAVRMLEDGERARGIAALEAIDFSGPRARAAGRVIALVVQAENHMVRGDNAAEAAMLRAAIPIAVENDQISMGVQAMSSLAANQARDGRLQEAKLLLDIAEALVPRAPQQDWLQAPVQLGRAQVAAQEGRIEDAIVLATQSCVPLPYSEGVVMRATHDLELARYLLLGAQPREAQRVAQRALDQVVAGAPHDKLLAADARVMLARAALANGEPKDALMRAQAVVPERESLSYRAQVELDAVLKQAQARL